MTHAFRRFIEGSMAQRDWLQSDLVRESGITKQVVSGLLNDPRERLDRLPHDKTVNGLARAFGVERGVVLTAIGEAMGLPMQEPTILYDATGVTNENLLRELADRLSVPGAASSRGRLTVVGSGTRGGPASDASSSGIAAADEWAARQGDPGLESDASSTTDGLSTTEGQSTTGGLSATDGSTSAD